MRHISLLQKKSSAELIDSKNRQNKLKISLFSGFLTFFASRFAFRSEKKRNPPFSNFTPDGRMRDYPKMRKVFWMVLPHRVLNAHR
jgi:hypothetical protein